MPPCAQESCLDISPPLHMLTSFNGSKCIPWMDRCFLTAGSSRVPATTRLTQDLSSALKDLLLTVEPQQEICVYFLASVFCTRTSSLIPSFQHMLRQALAAWSPISPWSLGIQALCYSNGTRNEGGRRRKGGQLSPRLFSIVPCLGLCSA